MKAAVDKDQCISCGLCPQLCPEVFEMGESDKARVKDDADYSSDCAREAAESCPVGAISVD